MADFVTPAGVLLAACVVMVTLSLHKIDEGNDGRQTRASLSAAYARSL